MGKLLNKSIKYDMKLEKEKSVIILLHPSILYLRKNRMHALLQKLKLSNMI